MSLEARTCPFCGEMTAPSITLTPHYGGPCPLKVREHEKRMAILETELAAKTPATSPARPRGLESQCVKGDIVTDMHTRQEVQCLQCFADLTARGHLKTCSHSRGIVVAEMVEARNLACLDLIMEDDFDVLLGVLYAARDYLAKLDSEGMAEDDDLRALVARFDFDTEARP